MDGAPLPVTNREMLLIAYACAEWDSVLTHLRALRQVGFRVPDEVVAHVADEWDQLCALWADVWVQDWSNDETVAHAQGWLTQHQPEIDGMLSGEVKV